MALLLYNTLTRQKEEFEPIDDKGVRMYTCGPTVYNFAHIGNLRAYVFADVLRRVLVYNDYQVRQIMNITDIGHLSSDADSGEDKMTKGLLREGKELTLENMRALAEFYTEKFNTDLKKLNVLPPTGQYFASDYVKEDIELVQKLESKGFAYTLSDGLYFDTEKMPDYGALWGSKRQTNEEYRRVNTETEKKNPEDFALWKFNPNIGFPSPWGQGFPGWHIECSAMGMKFLGEQFDIHTGGIDHISIHHTNEIAQSECATGKKPFVRFWLHSEFIDTAGEKMAKSGDNFLTLQTVIEHGISPVVYRFWLLMASYQTKMNFSWEALESSQVALKRLQRLYVGFGEEMGVVNLDYKNKFTERINDNLNTPLALSLLWDLVADPAISPKDKKATVLEFDKVLGLGFADIREDEIPDDIKNLLIERELARTNKDWKKSDEIREQIFKLGYELKDTEEGQKANKI